MSDVASAIEKLESKGDFEKTPVDQQKRWSAEVKAAKKRIDRWHKQGAKIQSRYQDRKAGKEDSDSTQNKQFAFRVNLFHSNIKTLQDMIYGNPPKVDVSRRFADSSDDQARVASSILSRMLNTSIEASGDDTKSVLGHCLSDRLLPGFGIARVRYEMDDEEVEVPAMTGLDGQILAEGYSETQITDERAPIDYVHWDDVLWGWARTWSEVPWLAFRTYPTKDKAEARFGKDVADKLSYKNKSVSSMQEQELSSEEVTDAWDRAEVWEIWEKESREVYWFSENCDKILDTKEDPLELFGFWPCPEPMLANCTTSLLLPQPDFALAQDLYNQVDQLESRISIITAAVKVVGVYDSSEEAISRMLQEGSENDLIPVKNWAAFAEGGALDGKVAWMPIRDIAEVLTELTKQRSDAMGLLYEVTGMAEIMRGANGPDRETAEAASGKRQFASVRVQGMSEDFARFASDLMNLRAEVISRHFDPKTIAKRSNIQASNDADMAEQAIQLIKQPEDAMWRIKISPESLAMLDYQALKKDRIDFIQALAQFFTSAMPLAQMDAGTVPALLQILKWTMSGFKGSNEIEGVLDKAIDQMLKQPPAEKKEPSPEELKMQADSAKHQQSMELQSLKHQQAMQAEMAKFQNTMKELQAEMQKDLKVIMAEMQAAIREEAAQSEAAMIQDDHETENQMKVDKNKVRDSGGSGEN